MKFIANFLTALVAILHVGILILEMFFWDHPLGQKILAMTPEMSAATALLAMNQGLYNGFLAVGLFWGLFSGRRDVKIFFLLCVVTAGVFGGLSVKTSILITQALPAFLALISIFMVPQARSGINNQYSHS